MDDMTDQADLTDPAFWGDVIQTIELERDWSAHQQAEWDAAFYALEPYLTPLNEDFTTT
jgi:hypothetical protein